MFSSQIESKRAARAGKWKSQIWKDITIKVYKGNLTEASHVELIMQSICCECCDVSSTWYEEAEKYVSTNRVEVSALDNSSTELLSVKLTDFPTISTFRGVSIIVLFLSVGWGMQ